MSFTALAMKATGKTYLLSLVFLGLTLLQNHVTVVNANKNKRSVDNNFITCEGNNTEIRRTVEL